jgi:hypothetical protein
MSSYSSSVVPPSTVALHGPHLGVCTTGAPMAPWRVRHRHFCRCVCCVYLVFGHSCNLVFFGGPICNLVA